MKFLPLIMLIPLSRLIVSDFRSREVSVVWLAILALATAGISLVADGWREVFVRSCQNLLLIAYLGIGIVAWAWIKARRLVNPIDSYIGMGDVLFFLALVPLFPLGSFAYLLVGGMVFSLLWWWIAGRHGKPDKPGKPDAPAHGNIPLVATSGIVMGAAIVIDTFFR